MDDRWALPLCLAALVALNGCVLDDIDEDGFGALLDCDDWNPLVSPTAIEACDGLDNNCDGRIDEGVKQNVYDDADGDGYGNIATVNEACEPADGQTARAGDCDDFDAEVHPGAPERCNGIDDDCNPDTVESDEAFWTTDAGTEVWTNQVRGSNQDRRQVVLTEPGTLLFCQGRYYVDFRIEGADVTIGAYDNGSARMQGGRDIPVVHVLDGATATLQGLWFTGGEGGLDRDGDSYGAGLACEGPGTTLVIEDTTFQGQDTRFGSSIAALDGCNTTIRDSRFLDVAEQVMHLDGGTHRIEGSFIGPADAHGHNWGEGGAYRNADVTLSGTTIERMLAHKGSAFSAVDSNVVVEPLGAVPSRLVGNAAGAGVVTLERSTLTATEWDLGSYHGGGDNDPPEIVVVDAGLSYMAGNDATFTCDSTGCGVPESISLGGASDAVTSGTYTRANLLYTEDWAVLQEMQVQASIDPDCTATAYLRGYPLEFDGVRRLADRERYPLSPSGEEGWLTTGPIRIGIPERDHTAYGVDVRCTDGGSWTWQRGAASVDVGFARWIGTGANADHDALVYDELVGVEAPAWSMRLTVTSF